MGRRGMESGHKVTDKSFAPVSAVTDWVRNGLPPSRLLWFLRAQELAKDQSSESRRSVKLIRTLESVPRNKVCAWSLKKSSVTSKTKAVISQLQTLTEVEFKCDYKVDTIPAQRKD
ncbi:hypothetical protein CgunFtcFv8_013594 [Champsocephalus gunnari]|uniref:Uncharacterized protein n=1 Tax=Champsocephalus gunnari TaxID=52237 RepID=A0AAN8DUR9_CHAGU|nr:hypothetical protein CgunFtcFv8_013594 [Champsocephalus gunnari]